MKYKLIIDKNAEEEITVIAHAPSALTQQIEDLVCTLREGHESRPEIVTEYAGQGKQEYSHADNC